VAYLQINPLIEYEEEVKTQRISRKKFGTQLHPSETSVIENF
jgi:hypothetical protein